MNIMWELKPSVCLAQGSVQWETGGLEERRQHLHDRRGQVSRAEGAKSQRGEASPGLQKLQQGCPWSGCPDTRQGALADFWQDSPGTGTSAQFQNWTTWSVRPSVSSRRHRGLSKPPSGQTLGAALKSLVPSSCRKLGSSPPRVQVDGCRGSPDIGVIKAL